MTTTLRNFLFVVIAMVALVLPADALFFSLRASTETRSYLEGRTRPKLAKLTWKAVVQGKWQAAFDVALAFCVPKRDEALLVDARWQRKMIGVAAWLFGFNAYPTFYGSRYCRLAKLDAIAPILSKATPELAKRLKDAAYRYANVMDKRQDIRWFFALTDRSEYSMANHLHDFVRYPVDYAYYLQHFAVHLPRLCTVIDLGYRKERAYYDDFFKTDIHWSIHGAVKAYGKIAAALNIEPLEFEIPEAVSKDRFFGTLVRLGRDDDITGDIVYDAPYMRSTLQVEVDGKSVPEEILDYGYKNITYKKTTKFEGMYTKFFHVNYGMLRITNQNIKKGVLVIVSDSFSNCMERFFAESYREVYTFDPRHSKVTLTKFLASHKVDDVLFLVGHCCLIAEKKSATV